MDVRSRSYGISCMMLYRGPQFTQEVAQYSSYLPPGVKISAMHSSQIAISGGIMPENEPVPLFWITKPVRDIGRCLCHVDRIDPGHRRAAGDCRKKLTKPLAPGEDLHFAAEVLYRARDPELAGPCIHKRAEPDTLHDSANRNSALFLHDDAAKIY